MDKLISADALIKTMQTAKAQSDIHSCDVAESFHNLGGDLSTEWWCVEDMVENAEPVDAIPVAWIEKYIDGLHNNSEVLLAAVAHMMLSKWRKEQDDRIQGE